MNFPLKSFSIALGALSLAGSLVAAPAGAGGSISCPGAPPLSQLEQNLLAKANAGDEPLRRYINLTSAMYGYEWNEVTRWVSARRTAEALCLAQAGSQRGAQGNAARTN